MEVLGGARKISGLEITRDRSIIALWLSPENYVLKVLEGFNMAEARFVITPLADHFRIILRVVSIYQARRRNVSSYPYACAVGSIMCAMVCSRFDLAYAGIRKSVHVKSENVTMGAVKWIFRCL